MSASLCSMKSMKDMAELQDAGSTSPKRIIQFKKKKLTIKVQAVSVTRFNDIPIEASSRGCIHRLIALSCENDRDLVTYGALTKTTFNAVFGRGGIWRRRFNDKFDYPAGGVTMVLGEESAAYEAEYKFRMENINKSNLWKDYQEYDIMNVLLCLIRDSFHVAPGQEVSVPVESKNMKFILELVRKLGLLDNFTLFNSKTGTLQVDDLDLNAVRLALFPWTLERAYLVWGYVHSRYIAFRSHGVEPIFFHGTFEINHTFLLHVCNFFAWHSSAHPENQFGLGTLFQNSHTSNKPKIWSSPLKQGLQKIGTSWLGMSALMHTNVRNNLLAGKDIDWKTALEYMNDENFDAYEIEMSDPTDEHAPKMSDFFEKLIHSLPPKELLQEMELTDVKEATHLPIQGYGYDGDSHHRFEIVGNVYALPEQGSIPGWQHISYLKFYPIGDCGKDFGWLQYTTLGEVRDGGCVLLAYEGIILPGNRVMVGRWFRPEGPRPEPTDDWEWQCDAGPEMIWCIDENEIEYQKSEQRFLPVDIVHNKVAPRPETMPKPPAGLNWLWDDQLRLPAPSKNLTVKKPKWGLLFRREEHYEIVNNLPVSCNLGVKFIEPELWGQGLPTAQPTNVAPEEQYRKMMDLWEVEKNVEKTESQDEKRAKVRQEIEDCGKFRFGRYRRPKPLVWQKRSQFILDSIYGRKDS